MRKDERTNVPPGLEPWLEVATRGLCAEAKARIQAEISDHYESALESELDAGASDPAAARSALSSLGDPVEAGRSFRRTNLTRFQAGLVEDYRGRPSRRVLLLHVGLLALGVVTVAMLAKSTAQWTLGLLAVAAIVSSIAVIHVLAPRASARGHLRTAVMASVLAQWLLYCALCIGLPFSTRTGPAGYVKVLYAAILALLLALYLPLLRKLTRLDVGRG